MSATSLGADMNDGITNTRYPGTNQIGMFLRAKVMLPPTIAVISLAVCCRRREEAKDTVPQPTQRWIKVDREPACKFAGAAWNLGEQADIRQQAKCGDSALSASFY